MGQAIETAGLAMATDMPSSFGEKSEIELVGFDTPPSRDLGLQPIGASLERVRIGRESSPPAIHLGEELASTG
jgi:hypothetical protein